MYPTCVKTCLNSPRTTIYVEISFIRSSTTESKNKLKQLSNKIRRSRYPIFQQTTTNISIFPNQRSDCETYAIRCCICNQISLSFVNQRVTLNSDI